MYFHDQSQSVLRKTIQSGISFDIRLIITLKLTWKVVVISGVMVSVPPFSVVCGGRMNSLVEAVTLLSSK